MLGVVKHLGDVASISNALLYHNNHLVSFSCFERCLSINCTYGLHFPLVSKQERILSLQTFLMKQIIPTFSLGFC